MITWLKKILFSQEVADLTAKLHVEKMDNIMLKGQIVLLEEKNTSLKYDAKVAQDAFARQAVLLNKAVTDAQAARQEYTDLLKRNINTLMLSAGSRRVMFEGVGPQPEPKTDTKSVEELAKSNPALRAREQRLHYMEQFAAELMSPAESLPYEEVPVISSEGEPHPDDAQEKVG